MNEPTLRIPVGNESATKLVICIRLSSFLAFWGPFIEMNEASIREATP